MSLLNRLGLTEKLNDVTDLKIERIVLTDGTHYFVLAHTNGGFPEEIRSVVMLKPWTLFLLALKVAPMALYTVFTKK